jgi:hypothetical protein
MATGLVSDALTPALGDNALRWAMSVTVLFNCWCGFHYYCCSKTIREDIRRAIS